MPAVVTWTRDRILASIRASAVDGVAKAEDMTLCVVARRKFGSWAASCRAAGVRAARDIPESRYCAVTGCGRAPRSRTAPHCEMHYYRLRRRGDVRPQERRTRRTLAANGYILASRRGHPVEGGGSVAYEHRVVLFDEIGPGVHACRWCGREVDWAKSYPTDPAGLVVDHLNGVKTDNRPDNLAPSCGRCNLARGAATGVR